MYRLQHEADGRGPFRPGFSRYWADLGFDRPTDIITAFGLDWRSEIPRGWASGCACTSLDALQSWFSSAELGRLSRMGFVVVEITPGLIIRQNDAQAIIAVPGSFADLGRVVEVAA